MSPFCLDLSLNLSTSTVSRVQAKCLHKLVCRGNRHFEFRRGRKVQKVERRVYVKPATVSKNGTDILTVDRYNTTKTTASTTKELIERVSMFENELNLFSEARGLVNQLESFKKKRNCTSLNVGRNAALNFIKCKSLIENMLKWCMGISVRTDFFSTQSKLKSMQ